MGEKKRRKRPRDKRRYDSYLRLKEVYPDMTFRDFLTNPCFQAIRNG